MFQYNSLVSLFVGHDLVTSFISFTICIIKWNHFQRCIWSPRLSEHPDEGSEQWTELGSCTEIPMAFGFSVKDAVLFPPEVERGMWPENYSLSDHAPLTVVFSPVKLSFATQIY